jgi:hypothetical protein
MGPIRTRLATSRSGKQPAAKQENSSYVDDPSATSTTAPTPTTQSKAKGPGPRHKTFRESVLEPRGISIVEADEASGGPFVHFGNPQDQRNYTTKPALRHITI